MEIGSPSTIRHHCFALKEKDTFTTAFVAPHKTATMVDDRYGITEEEQEGIQKFFPEGVQEGLENFPSKEKQRLIVIREIARHLEDDKYYTEKQLSEWLNTIYEDEALIRRYLMEYGFLNRKRDGSEYWLKK